MDKWIEILKAGVYPQGDISNALLKQIAENYDPSYIQAPVISKHRQFNDKGELINNEAALGWIKAVKASDGSLYALFENEDSLKNLFDGKNYKYASVEIQNENINGKEVAYLGALAATNFPASKIQQIKFNDNKVVKVYSNQFIIEDQEMKPEQLKQLCKVLELKEESTAEEVVAHVTQLIAKVKDADAVTKLTEVLKLIKVEEPQKKDDENPDITKLTATVNELSTTVKNFAIQLDTNADEKTEMVFNQGIADKKFLPSQKDLFVGSKEKPGTYYKNPEGLKKFAATLPVLNINPSVTVPKDQAGKPLSYQQVVNNMKLYNEMRVNNPEALEELRKEWMESPEPKK